MEESSEYARRGNTLQNLNGRQQIMKQNIQIEVITNSCESCDTFVCCYQVRYFISMLISRKKL